MTHVFIHWPQADQRSLIDFYGRELLALVRGAVYGAAVRSGVT